MSGGSENGTNNACIQHDVCELKLRCRIITKSIKTDDIITSTCSLDSTRPNVKHPTLLWFDPEHGKRASFILINIVTQQGEDRKESDDDNAVLVGEDEKRNNYQYYRTLLEILDKPASVVIDCCPYTGSNLSDATETCSFIFGGIDMISNCRTIEIYVIDLQAKETYVTTSRGVKLSSSDQNGNEWFHNVITRPGGPQLVMAVKLKLIMTNAIPKHNFFTELTCASSVSSSQSSYSNSSSSNENSNEENDGVSPEGELQEEGTISLNTDNNHDEEDKDINPVKISSLKVKGRMFAASSEEKNKNDCNVSQPSITTPNYYLSQQQQQQQQQEKAINSTPIASTYNAADNAVHSSVALGMALMMKSLEENLLNSVNALESKISNVENQVKNLNQYVSSSYQMILHQQIQLIQAQNAFISHELSEVKNTLKSGINSYDISDDIKFMAKEVAENMNNDSVTPASENVVSETSPCTETML